MWKKKNCYELSNYNIYSIKSEKNKFIMYIVIMIIIILICLVLIAKYSIESIQRNILYTQYEAQLEQIQVQKDEEQAKIKAEEEEKRKSRIPQLTEIGKQNVENIYSSETKRIFLTFDDGPSVNTSSILDILKQENITATFFMLGNFVEARPDIVKRAYEEGNYIANHGYSHVYSSIYISPEAVLDEYNRCNTAVQNAIGVPEYNSHLFRFPGGLVGGKYAELKVQAKQLLNENNIVNVDWNALTGDSEIKKPTEEFLMNRLRETTEGKNSIVLLMHDSPAKEITIQILPQVIAYLREQGYEFKNFYEIIK